MKYKIDRIPDDFTIDDGLIVACEIGGCDIADNYEVEIINEEYINKHPELNWERISDD